MKITTAVANCLVSFSELNASCPADEVKIQCLKHNGVFKAGGTGVIRAFSPHSPVSLASALASKGSASEEEAFLNGPVFLLKQVKSV